MAAHIHILPSPFPPRIGLAHTNFSESANFITTIYAPKDTALGPAVYLARCQLADIHQSQFAFQGTPDFDNPPVSWRSRIAKAMENSINGGNIIPRSSLARIDLAQQYDLKDHCKRDTPEFRAAKSQQRLENYRWKKSFSADQDVYDHNKDKRNPGKGHMLGPSPIVSLVPFFVSSRLWLVGHVGLERLIGQWEEGNDHLCCLPKIKCYSFIFTNTTLS